MLKRLRLSFLAIQVTDYSIFLNSSLLIQLQILEKMLIFQTLFNCENTFPRCWEEQHYDAFREG